MCGDRCGEPEMPRPREDMIDGPVLGGAATYIETATKSDINLFI